MKIILSNILLTYFLIINYSCNTTEPPISPPPEQPKTVKLKPVETTCTEAFINVAAEDTGQNQNQGVILIGRLQ